MSLAPFTIIVAIDAGNGIAKDGGIPWQSTEDMKFFRDTTIGRKKNAVIMGRVTYETIPEKFRPLKDRHCAVISRQWKQEDHPDVAVYSSLGDALAGVGASLNQYEEVFIAGGEQVYKEAIRDYLYLCQKIHITKFKNDYSCDQFFPFDIVQNFDQAQDPVKTRDYTRFTYVPNIYHDEYQYLQILRDIKDKGEPKPDRTGVGTRSLFSTSMIFDIRERIPVLTTKKLYYEHVIRELLFFISGKTNTKILEDQGTKIWKGNTSKEYLQKHNLPWNEGDMGAGYGFQWRHWGAEYKGCDVDYKGQGIDQLKNLIENIRQDPHSRRHILTAWNVSDLDKMALHPCHMTAQFNVSADRKWLDCLLDQRSGDFFLGIPFNILSYALLTYMIAHITGLRARKLVLVCGDSHIYNNHGEQVMKQLGRTPRPFPTLKFRDSTRLHEIDDFNFDSFIIEGYTSWQAITADMAV